jgi:membrane protein
VKFARVVRCALRGFFADRCPRDAAAIAYRVLFASGPLLIVCVSIFGLVLQDEAVRDAVVDAVVAALPVSAAGRDDVEEAIATIASPASAAGLISLALFAWTASAMMAAIRVGLETAVHAESRPPAHRGKIIDTVLVAGAALLVLVTVALTFAGDLMRNELGTRLGDAGRIDTLVGGVVRAGAFALSVGVVLLLYRFVPARRLRVRDSVAGAVVTALLLQVISLASALIYAKTTSLSVIYGSLTTALFFVYSMYLYSSALLFGAEVAAMWSQPEPVSGAPLRRRVKQLVLRSALREARRIT